MKPIVTALVALSAVFVLACGGSMTAPDSSSGGAPGTASSAGTDAAGDTSASQAIAEAKLIYTSSVDLEVKSLRPAYDQIVSSARSLGGFVADANIADSQKQGSASLKLRVPAARHNELVASLRGLSDSTVKREVLGAREVTAQYTDLQSRLRNLEANEAQYLELLRKANSINDVLAITARLDSVRGEIERAKGQLNLIDDQAAFATVNVGLIAAPAGASNDLPTPLEVLVDALASSLVVAHVLANAFVVLFVAGLWLLPAGLILALFWRHFGRGISRLWVRVISW